MKLLIDIGNTRIKWAYHDATQETASVDNRPTLIGAGDRVHRNSAPLQAMDFVDELSAVPDSVVAVNVAGKELEAALGAAIKEKFGLQLTLVRTASRCGPVINGYASVEQLGADRWAAIVGAWFSLREAVCVIDAGTAVTVDAVASGGEHLGGMIVPGMSLMQDALYRDTSDIRRFSEQGMDNSPAGDWYGHDTRSAVSKGLQHLLRAALNRAIGDMAENGTLPRVILTGGDAENVAAMIESAFEYRPSLVLEGLHYMSSGQADA